MVALQVALNSRNLFTAGAPDLRVLTAIITALFNGDAARDEMEQLDLAVGGYATTPCESHLKWPSVPLSLGDTITISIVQTDKPDPPETRRSEDPEFVTKQRRRYFEKLKAEFEPE